MSRFLLAALVAVSMQIVAPTMVQAQDRVCEPAKVAQKYPEYAGKVVKIATSVTYIPYTYADPKNLDRLIGVEAEAIEKVMACAGLKYEYLKGQFAGLMTVLFSGSADVMLGNINYRADRAEKADFILYTRNGQSVVMLKDNPRSVPNIVSLCGLTGASSIGGSSALEIDRQNKACLERGAPALTFAPAPDLDSAYRLLSAGRSDFVMDNVASAAARLAIVPDFKVVFTMTTDIPAGFIVPKGNAAMARIVEDGLKVQEKDGSLAALMTKYGMTPELLIPIEIRR